MKRTQLSTNDTWHLAAIPNDLMPLLSGSRKARKAILRRLSKVPPVVAYLRDYVRQNQGPLPIHIEAFLPPVAEQNIAKVNMPSTGGCGCTSSEVERALARRVDTFRSSMAHGSPLCRAAFEASFDALGRYYDPVSGYWESVTGLFRDPKMGKWMPAYDEEDEAEAMRVCHEERQENHPPEAHDDPLEGSYESDVPVNYAGPVAMRFCTGFGPSETVVFPNLREAEQAAGFAVRYDLGGYADVALTAAPNANPDFKKAESWMFDVDEANDDES